MTGVLSSAATLLVRGLRPPTPMPHLAARLASCCRYFGSLALLVAAAGPVRAQALAPGGFTPAPVGMNIVTAIGTLNRGAVAFDPSLPVEDAHATVGVGGVAFSRTLPLAGRFASVTLGIPVVTGHVRGLVRDEPQE